MGDSTREVKIKTDVAVKEARERAQRQEATAHEVDRSMRIVERVKLTFSDTRAEVGKAAAEHGARGEKVVSEDGAKVAETTKRMEAEAKSLEKISADARRAGEIAKTAAPSDSRLGSGAERVRETAVREEQVSKEEAQKNQSEARSSEARRRHAQELAAQAAKRRP